MLCLLALGCASTPPPPPNAALQQPDHAVAAHDLRILERADAILADESRWDRTDDRTCPPDAPRVSLFCALQKACIEVLGFADIKKVLALARARLAARGSVP